MRKAAVVTIPCGASGIHCAAPLSRDEALLKLAVLIWEPFEDRPRDNVQELTPREVNVET